MLSRILGKVAFRVADNHVYYCSLADLDLQIHQPRHGCTVLHLERVDGGIAVTEGEWDAAKQSIYHIVNHDLYDKESMRQSTEHTSTTICPYLQDEIDLWKVNPHWCEVTGNALDHFHARDRCKCDGWESCPVYLTKFDPDQLELVDIQN